MLLGDFSTCEFRAATLQVPPAPEALFSLSAGMMIDASMGDGGNHGKVHHNRQTYAVKLCFPLCDAITGSNHIHGPQYLASLDCCLAFMQPLCKEGSF